MRMAASVLVTALIVAGCGGAAGSARPATQAPATQEASPAAAREFYDGYMAAGTYRFLKGVGTFDAPTGWEGCCDAWGVVKKNTGAALLFEDATDVIVYADACHWKQGPNPEPRGAQATAAAFAAQAGHQGTEPKAITIGGLPGWHVRLTVPANQRVTGPTDDLLFTGCDDSVFASWTLKSQDSPARFAQVPGQVDDLYIVDVGDKMILFDRVSEPTTDAAVNAELDAMLASVKFS